LFRTWKRRHFRLTADNISYFENDKALTAAPLGVIEIRSILQVRPPLAGDSKFEIRTIRGKDFKLNASSHDEAMKWTNDIRTIQFAPGTITLLQARLHRAAQEGKLSEAVRSCPHGLPCTGCCY
jgi:hypothetical protein